MTTIVDRSAAYCVIGAGAGGISAAKNLMQYGIEVDVIEASVTSAGSGTRRTRRAAPIHLITSKPYIQYPDFPIPAEIPNLSWPSARPFVPALLRHALWRHAADRIPPEGRGASGVAMRGWWTQPATSANPRRPGPTRHHVVSRSSDRVEHPSCSGLLFWSSSVAGVNTMQPPAGRSHGLAARKPGVGERELGPRGR
ncbi:MAG: Flavin-containing monooxygenase [Mycobacterium sp.]|nr:Flavin-containing monooxygenase [Mycobacterium sp.]